MPGKGNSGTARCSVLGSPTRVTFIVPFRVVRATPRGIGLNTGLKPAHVTHPYIVAGIGQWSVREPKKKVLARRLRGIITTIIIFNVIPTRI